MAITVELEHDDDVVDELLLTTLENGVEIGQKVREEQLNKLVLELGRELFVKAVLFDDHAMVAPEGPPQFVLDLLVQVFGNAVRVIRDF